MHLGSLFIAAASFLHARQAAGRWLVRIEDIDPPREVRGAADDILRTLEKFELPWDGPVLRQSTRLDVYRAAVQRLLVDGSAFRCSCSRRTLAQAGGPYPGTCRTGHRATSPTSVRVRVEPGIVGFVDELQGTIEARLDEAGGDYIIARRDGLPAYHLAVVLDDAAQGVTAIVRGSDLLDSTATHVHLQRTLGLASPRYWHAPVVVDDTGQKLSKQTGAPPVSSLPLAVATAMVLQLLGTPAPAELCGARPRELWAWALDEWRVDELKSCRTLRDPSGRLQERGAPAS